MRGVFSGQKIIDGKIVQEFSIPNKITIGARTLITNLLATKIKNYTVRSLFGIDQFVLFDINSVDSSCVNQMILGSFTNYDTFDPLYLSSITSTTFPCLGSNHIVVTEISNDLTEEPGTDESLMVAIVVDNSISITIKIGTGYISTVPGKYALAGLFGLSPNSIDNNLYCYAIDQFPVMVKTETTEFKFEWTCFI